MNIQSIESLYATIEQQQRVIKQAHEDIAKLTHERDAALAENAAYYQLAKKEVWAVAETALREAKEAIKFLQCNTDDYYDSAREASAQGDKTIANINKVLGEK